MNLYCLTLGAGMLMAALSAHAGSESSLNPGPIAIILNNEINIDQLSIAELGLIYLKKKSYWKTGIQIQAINLPSEHVLRQQFSQLVMGSLPDEQANYWNTLYFNGVHPPQMIESQEGMIRLVSATPGAIGYLHPCAVDKRVKQVLWIYPDGRVSKQAPRLACNSWAH